MRGWSAFLILPCPNGRIEVDTTMDHSTLTAVQASFETVRRNQAVAIALLERELEDEAFRSKLGRERLDQAFNEEVRLNRRTGHILTTLLVLLIVADLLLLAMLLPRWTRGTESSPIELLSADSERKSLALAESRSAASEPTQEEVPDVR